MGLYEVFRTFASGKKQTLSVSTGLDRLHIEDKEILEVVGHGGGILRRENLVGDLGRLVDIEGTLDTREGSLGHVGGDLQIVIVRDIDPEDPR